jgi:TDG/mug DNA glycosylase family protein
MEYDGMADLYGFPPIADAHARVLILGSMPGQASLNAQQYYAHPRNLFWPMMAQLLQFDPALDYPARAQALKKHGVALWDVLQSCQREGSLDANIRQETANDFNQFLVEHPQIRTIFFNGDKAAKSFRQWVMPHLNQTDLAFIRLPSTSPANASQSLDLKQLAWQQILTYLA